MNKKLYEALKVIGETCSEAECCGKCPLYYNTANPFRDSMCVFGKHNPATISTHIVESYEFDFSEVVK